MNTATRALVAFVAPLLLAGTAVAATAASASTVPGAAEATPASVCASVGGELYEDQDGGGDCYYDTIDLAVEASLSAVCGSSPLISRLPANGVSPTASTSFYCQPGLIN